MLWKRCLRPLLFRSDAERVHHFSMGLFSSLSGLPLARQLTSGVCRFEDPRLAIDCLGTRFENPVMLAAGFDKNALWFNALHRLGFSAIEVGTVTWHQQPGNDQPRLFRLPQDAALLNRMGFNNEGAEAVAERLAGQKIVPKLGINLGKSKITPLAEAVDDYLASFQALARFADYVTVNVSSPNTPGLRSLQDRQPLGDLLRQLQSSNQSLANQQQRSPLPILLKIAPDLTDEALDDVADLCIECSIGGIIATNTTIERTGLATPAEQVEALGAGGVSGRPLTERSRQVVSHLYRRLENRIPVIGVGGLMNDEDVWEMLRAGATMVQVYTGFIYGGPRFVRQLLAGLSRRLDGRSLNSLSAIIGEKAA